MSQSLSNTKENVTASGLRKFAKEYTMLLFVIVLVIACMLFVDRFATPGNLMNVLIQIAINALIATGMTFVILNEKYKNRCYRRRFYRRGGCGQLFRKKRC